MRWQIAVGFSMLKRVDRVTMQTVQRATEVGLRALMKWNDLDNVFSVEIFRASLNGQRPFGSARLKPALAAHTRVLPMALDANSAIDRCVII